MRKKRVIPIHGDAVREGKAKTPSKTGVRGQESLRDPGLGVGDEGDEMFTLSATAPHMVAQLDDEPDPAKVFYQGSYGGWTDDNPGMLGTGSRLHLVTGEPGETGYDLKLDERIPDDRLTHASFFSGVGGLDMGFDVAGWRTVSFSEIDPYAIEVLSRHWPEVPNLGSIVDLVEAEQAEGLSREPDDVRRARLDERMGAAGRASAGDASEDAIGGDDAGDPASDRNGRGLGSGQPGRVGPDDRAWTRAALWTGGFPCQDLSVAGKRRGMGAGTRSGLAFAFLDLAALHRPDWILLENVPGLLSSHRGADFKALLGALAELGYGVAYRVLDSQYFGVPQRRRRVFILADATGGRAGAERAAEILSVGSVCDRHPPQGIEAREGAPDGAAAGSVLAREGKGVGRNFPDDHLVGAGSSGPAGGRDRVGVPHPDIVGTIAAGLGHHGNAGQSRQAVAAGHVIPEYAGSLHTRMDGHTGQDDRGNFLVPDVSDTLRVGASRAGSGGSRHAVPLVSSSPADTDRVREADGLAGRLDDRPGLEGQELAATLNSGGNDGGFRTEPGAHLVVAPQAFRKATKAHGSTDDDEERWEQDDVLDTIPAKQAVGAAALVGEGPSEEVDLLPTGLDSHRYRCCGNGVVAPVAQFLAERIAAQVRKDSEHG